MRAGGMKRRKAATDVQSLEVRVDDRVQVLVGIEDDDGVLVHEQLDAALQLDGAGAPDAGGHDEPSPALLLERSDGFRKGVGVQGDAVAHGAEVRQDDFALRNGRKRHPRHVEGSPFVQGGEFVGFSTPAGGCEGEEREEEKTCFHLWSQYYVCKYKKYFRISVYGNGNIFNIPC